MIYKRIVLFLFLFPFNLFAQSHDQIDRFIEVYLDWDALHPEFKCEILSDSKSAHSLQTVWRMQGSDVDSEMMLGIVSDIPIPHESYVFSTEEGDYVMYFPEINRTVLLCSKDDFPSVEKYRANLFFASLEFIKPFVMYEELRENDDSISLELILDGNKMVTDGAIPKGAAVDRIRLIFLSGKDGQPFSASRQFDDDEVEVSHFNYLSFSSDEVHTSFPKIENRSSSSITPGFTIKDALEEIDRGRMP